MTLHSGDCFAVWGHSVQPLPNYFGFLFCFSFVSVLFGLTLANKTECGLLSEIDVSLFADRKILLQAQKNILICID